VRSAATRSSRRRSRTRSAKRGTRCRCTSRPRRARARRTRPRPAASRRRPRATRRRSRRGASGGPSPKPSRRGSRRRKHRRPRRTRAAGAKANPSRARPGRSNRTAALPRLAARGRRFFGGVRSVATVKEIPAKLVAELRARTGAGMMDCKKALQETGGDLEKAVDLLRQRGAVKAEKRAGREASEGVIGSYVHHDGSIGVLVEVNCETDFVARTEDFKVLAKDLAIHIAATRPLAVRVDDLPPTVVERERQVYEALVKEQEKPEAIRAKVVEGMMKKFYEETVLLEQKFAKDDKRTVGELVKALAAKTGENVQVRRFVRYELGGT